MMDRKAPPLSSLATSAAIGPAEPLWRLAPTRGRDGISLADFMMVIPGLGQRPENVQRHAMAVIREVCESYPGQVVFADINFTMNVLWVSVAGEPGLAGRVARSIRTRLPDALLVGGYPGFADGLSVVVPRRVRWWRRLRALPRRVVLLADRCR